MFAYVNFACVFAPLHHSSVQGAFNIAYLTTKLIARKCKNSKPRGLRILCMECLQLLIILVCKTSLARHIDDEANISPKDLRMYIEVKKTEIVLPFKSDNNKHYSVNKWFIIIIPVFF